MRRRASDNPRAATVLISLDMNREHIRVAAYVSDRTCNRIDMFGTDNVSLYNNKNASR